MAMNDQPNMTNEEFISLFSRNLTLQAQPPVQPAPPKQEIVPEPEPIIYSISQHYTHSAHIVRSSEPAEEPQRRSSEPPQSQQPSAEDILRHHGVNPGTLSMSQMELFKTAEDSQKLRLIELWQICPPSNPQANPSVAWTSTTVEQEELLAQLRYERKLEEDAQMQGGMTVDDTPLTPVQSSDGQWTAISYMEPYMMSGYEEMARREYEESAKRQLDEDMGGPKTPVYSHFGSAVSTYRPATDPVYDNNDWVRRQQAMENQYGAYQMGGEMEL
ncbi:hypothetical protein BX600DRAFT_508109 [Xylariales sp. PMI_506]|nr:hypothetical protein BX600DRAFT_508109 [Xylariales sp. PMI_506]